MCEPLDFERREIFNTFANDTNRIPQEAIDGDGWDRVAAELDSFETKFWEKNQAGTGTRLTMDPAAEFLAENAVDEVPDEVHHDNEGPTTTKTKKNKSGQPGMTPALNPAQIARSMQPTLAAIRKDAKRQAQESRLLEADAERAHLAKRVKINNMTDQDSVLRETKLNTYFCRFCGEWVLITDAGRLTRLPRRRTDGAMVIQETKFISRLNVTGAKRKTIIKRDGSTMQTMKDGAKKETSLEALCEAQYRFQCKCCGSLVGYRSEPLGETAPATYIYQDTLVDKQTSALKFVNNVTTF
ncbi:unnamed protein product [Amoebophrya sp. A120]|nr:unnamed protein product [Amoebophrya sp. A120]|eukprot:GSA120T00013096001.1